MPRQETRESIEAELNATPAEQLINGLRRALANFDEMERHLRQIEALVWQPHWRVNDPLFERLARVGIEIELLRELQQLLNSLDALQKGEPIPAELSERFRQADLAERSALEQLDAIVRTASHKFRDANHPSG